MNKYVEYSKKEIMPRIPQMGHFDPTYRCNNNCRHCWIRISPKSKEINNELKFEEIVNIVEETRKMGCRRWSFSGGEPLLRPDFPDIFDYTTRKAYYYSLNTNGTFITPRIAKLFKKRKGRLMVAIYGATSKVHDFITRNQGSFDATLRGMSYLREAKVDFTVQIVPMKGNYHEYQKMISLGKKYGTTYRLGATWLYLSMHNNLKQNEEIKNQRLSPKIIAQLSYNRKSQRKLKPEFHENHSHIQDQDKDQLLFKYCLAARKEFYIDPYGRMTFCSFLKDPSLQYDLRKGSFWDAWEKFIPSIIKKRKGNKEYQENCGSCDLKFYCQWCPAFSYLENGSYTTKIQYLCEVTKEKLQM